MKRLLRCLSVAAFALLATGERQEARAYPGGFCTLNCDSDSDCTRGAICMAREGGVCLLPCSAFAQCEFLGQGWDCAVIDSKNSPQRMRGVCVGD